MKTERSLTKGLRLHLLLLVLLVPFSVFSQITSPVIKANFGVDADLRANIFSGSVVSGNDDWFRDATSGTGRQVIDTTGAAAMTARLATDTAFRRRPFFRKMAVDQYSALNSRLWIDAIMVRDHSGIDTSAYVFTNKNGQSPRLWSGGTQPVPDKNDIGDIFAHLRRAGTSLTDSLWFFGGISLMGTTGNRYFDFELYQTDLIYDMNSKSFINYGLDSGHTSWQFDLAGNVTRPGDIIFTAEYSSSGLSFVEARIWIRGSDTLTVSPSRFNWATGKFDGGAVFGSVYGYKSIIPKTAGDFYSGTQSAANTWAGPFGMINNLNGFETDYSTRQFMEFSVNLTKLGLDPIDLLGTGNCNMPFTKIVVKSRAATEFSAELKDFVGPFSIFAPARADIATNLPFLCTSNSYGDLWVTNPLSTSHYTWTTSDGNIVSSNTGPSIQVNEPGTYIVTQRLYAGCTPYATDTVAIGSSGVICTPLSENAVVLKGVLQQEKVLLNWQTDGSNQYNFFELERSVDGKNFTLIKKVVAESNAEASYSSTDQIGEITEKYLFYRLKIFMKNGVVKYSNQESIEVNSQANNFHFSPNPATSTTRLTFVSPGSGQASYYLIDNSGRALKKEILILQKGNNSITLDVSGLPGGIYQVVLRIGKVVKTGKLIVQQN